MNHLETVFNLFIFIENGIIEYVGVTTHKISGTDDYKINFLKNHIEGDLMQALKFPVPDRFKITLNNKTINGIDFTTFRDLSHTGHSLLLFEDVFINYNATEAPICVLTPVKNGKITIDGTENFKIMESKPSEQIHIELQKMWYEEYIDEDGFHLERLINDDFFNAIKLTFNDSKYVSSTKLLMTTIDTIAYLEYGDTKNNFQKWLNEYSKLKDIDVEADELWEFRNSILHMTNLDSRKVNVGKVRRLLFYISSENKYFPKETDEGKYFNLNKLIEIIAGGIKKWGNSYNDNKDKFKDFIDRYERILSDQRMTFIHYKS